MHENGVTELDTPKLERLATERDAMQPFFAQAILQLQHMLETNQLKGRKPEDVIVVLKM